MDESPKWLLSAGREMEARQLLNKIVRVNKLEAIDVDTIVHDSTLALIKVTIQSKTLSHSIEINSNHLWIT